MNLDHSLIYSVCELYEDFRDGYSRATQVAGNKEQQLIRRIDVVRKE